MSVYKMFNNEDRMYEIQSRINHDEAISELDLEEFPGNMRDAYGDTPAMLCAAEDLVQIPPEWHHDPLLTNDNGETVAMIWANNRSDPIPKEWEHEPTVRDLGGHTVALNWAGNDKRSIPIPDFWHHDPAWQDIDGCTVAMQLAWCHKISTIPEEWRHDPTLQEGSGWTVAMLIAGQCRFEVFDFPEWYHDPTIADKGDATVAAILVERGTVVPRCWNYEEGKGPVHKSYKGLSKSVLMEMESA